MSEKNSKKQNLLRIPSIVAAMSELDPEKHFTKSGKPECSLIDELLGFEVSAEERDLAFAEFKKAQEKTAASQGNTVVTMEHVLARMEKKGGVDEPEK